MGRFLIGLLWPKGLMGFLGRITGSLSLLALYRIGFELGLGPTLQTLTDYYNRLVGLVFGIFEPSLISLISSLGVNLNLMPHWRHVYILMGVYIFMSARKTFDHHFPTGLFRMINGILVALLAAIVCGTISLTKNDFPSYVLIAGAPVLGVFLFNSLNGVWNATFRAERERHYHDGVGGWASIALGHVSAAFRRTVVAFLIIGLAYQIPAVRNLEGASLLVLAILILLMSTMFLREGLDHAKRDRAPNEPLVDAYFRSSSYKLGASMVGYFIWMGLFLVLNAGLGYWGL